MSQLTSILINLSQSILSTQQKNKLKICIMLLKSLDGQYFSQNGVYEIKTFYQLYPKIQKYYEQKFEQSIVQSFFYNNQIQQNFICIYQLIFDLALKNTIDKKEQFLTVILQMNEQQKNIMMQFVGQIVKRQMFVKKDQTYRKQSVDIYEKIENQSYIQLKTLFNELQRKYQDLQQSYQSLKQSYERKDSQMKQFQSQKLQFLAELGLHLNSGYIQIAQKYKKDITEYMKEIQRVQKQLQQQKSQILHKNNQMQLISKKHNIKQEQLQNYYKQKIITINQKLIKMQRHMEKQHEKQSQFQFQIIRLKDAVVNLRKQIEHKNIQLNQQQKIIQKFNTMKKIHLQYRKQMIHNFRKTELIQQNLGF